MADPGIAQTTAGPALAWSSSAPARRALAECGDPRFDLTRAPARIRTDILADCDRALLLFGAAFLGVNDAIHLAAAALADVTVVDIDSERLDAMRALYPDTWELVAAHAFDFVQRRHAAGERYDLVSADPTTPLMPRCRAELPKSRPHGERSSSGSSTRVHSIRL